MKRKLRDKVCIKRDVATAKLFLEKQRYMQLLYITRGRRLRKERMTVELPVQSHFGCCVYALVAFVVQPQLSVLYEEAQLLDKHGSHRWPTTTKMCNSAVNSRHPPSGTRTVTLAISNRHGVVHRNNTRWSLLRRPNFN